VRETYAAPLPGMNLAEMTGKLIVIEGTDGVGRSTQIRLLRPWLEQQGERCSTPRSSARNLPARAFSKQKRATPWDASP